MDALTSTCPNCAAANAKWQRAKAEGAELRLQIEEHTRYADRSAQRALDLDEALRRAREELAECMGIAEAARAAEAAARSALEAEAAQGASRTHAERAAAEHEATLAAEAQRAREAEAAMRARLAQVEAEAARSRSEADRLAATAEEARAQAASEHERRSRLAASAEDAAARSRQAAAQELSDAMQLATQCRDAREAAEARLQEERRRREAAEEETARVRADLEAQLAAAAAAYAALVDEHSALTSRCEKAAARAAASEAENEGHRLQSSKLASAVARAQQAEGDQKRAEDELRERVDAAEAAAAAATAELAKGRAEASRARQEAADGAEAVRTLGEQLAAAQAQLVQPLNVRELLSAIKVAVLAPCIKLHVNDSEPRHVGSPAQVRLPHAILTSGAHTYASSIHPHLVPTPDPHTRSTHTLQRAPRVPPCARCHRVLGASWPAAHSPSPHCVYTTTHSPPRTLARYASPRRVLIARVMLPWGWVYVGCVQIDYEQLGSMLEAAVLNRFSQVRLLDTDTPLAHDGAHAIFPELKETMAHVQKEVRERLAAMMASAGD